MQFSATVTVGKMQRKRFGVECMSRHRNLVRSVRDAEFANVLMFPALPEAISSYSGSAPCLRLFSIFCEFRRSWWGSFDFGLTFGFCGQEVLILGRVLVFWVRKFCLWWKCWFQGLGFFDFDWNVGFRGCDFLILMEIWVLGARIFWIWWKFQFWGLGVFHFDRNFNSWV